MPQMACDCHFHVFGDPAKYRDSNPNPIHKTREANWTDMLHMHKVMGFDRGVTLLHSFWYYEAERAFRWCNKLEPENAALRVVVDPKTGCITSLYDKKTSFETLAPGACGNVL